MSVTETAERLNMYEAPSITELGSVADFTKQGSLAFDFDGSLFKDRNGGGGGGATS